jgi:diaminopimelate epimerase
VIRKTCVIAAIALYREVMSRSFIKMNGLGNDFVIVQPGEEAFEPTPDQAREICDRIDGVGCDQLIVLDPSETATIRMRIWNADGSEVAACGNAARCVGWLFIQAGKRGRVTLETAGGVLEATKESDGAVTVDMGVPRLEWDEIPLSGPADTLEMDLRVAQAKGGPGAVSMGNPHVVFFVDNVDTAPVDTLGPWLEKHQRFPEGVNVGFAQIVSPERIRLRVWERGVGVTRSCGTGACAALVAASRRKLAARRATIETEGGDLIIEWRESDGHVLMTGAVEVEFTGRLPSLNPPAPEAALEEPPFAANDFGDDYSRSQENGYEQDSRPQGDREQGYDDDYGRYSDEPVSDRPLGRI